MWNGIPKSMAPIVLPAPGAPGHYQYADVIARRSCSRCLLAIGYRQPFYFVHPEGEAVEHVRCRDDRRRGGRGGN
jgi:hypothetical protein